MSPKKDIKNLVKLICEESDNDDLDEKILNCVNSYINPLKYIKDNGISFIDKTPNAALSFALSDELADVAICGDRLHEIHEEIMSQLNLFLEYNFLNKTKTPKDYFIWLDTILAENDLDIINLDTGVTDYFMLFLVSKKNAIKILDLSSKYKILFTQPKLLV